MRWLLHVLVDSEVCTYCDKSLDAGIRVFGCVPCCTSLCMSCSPFEEQPFRGLPSEDLGAGLHHSPDLCLPNDGVASGVCSLPIVPSFRMPRNRRVAALSIPLPSPTPRLGQGLKVRAVMSSLWCYWNGFVVCPPLFQLLTICSYPKSLSAGILHSLPTSCSGGLM